MIERDIEPVASLTQEESQDLDMLMHGLRERAEQHARNAIDWYLRSRQPKKRCARTMRSGAITFVGFAGIIPLLSEMAGFRWLNSTWSTIALGLAALLVAYDRFFGCSMAWMRFMSTEHEIRQALHRFQYDMEELRLQWVSGKPDRDQATAYLARARAFIIEVDGLIQAETNLWLAEFRGFLEKIDTALHEREKAPVGTGGINVILSNVDEVEGAWQMQVDSRAPSSHEGQTAAVTGLLRGQHTLRVTAMVNGETRTAEQVVDVRADATADVTITL
jgi:hypothetical protein